MEKKISFSTAGQRADIGDIAISRILPNRYANAVGPFVFLDHILPAIQTRVNKRGTGAHPHRGIATLTYLLQGEAEHFDSRGNHARVHSGGVQWMNAGNGIIHDETLNADSITDSKAIHAVQFWISLPSKTKAEQPAYLSIAAEDVPVKTFADGSGLIRVLAGAFEEMTSAIPSYSSQFLYHVQLKPAADFSIDLAEGVEVAAFVAKGSVEINSEVFNNGEFIEFDRAAGKVHVTNKADEPVDVLLFGGEHYAEPIVAKGPFVMNSFEEIAEAYRDYSAGKYGTINYGGER